MELKPGYKLSEVGVIPEDWDVKPLVDITDKIMVGIASAATHAYRTKGVPMFRNQNIKAGRLEDTDLLFIAPKYEVTFKNKRLRAGDLLTMRTGYPGVTAIVPPMYDSAQSFTTLITRPNQRKVESPYLCHYVNSEMGQQFFNQSQIGGAQKNVNVGTLRTMPVPLPKPPEQRAIAQALNNADALLAGLERLIAKKSDLKRAAMQQLLTGQTRLPGFHGEWKTMRFRDLAVPRRERIDPRRSGIQEFCLELEHIESMTGQILGCTKTGADSSLKSVFHPGDVLFGKLRAYLRKYWLATRPGVCSTEIWVLVPCKGVTTSEFLFQIVQTDSFIEVTSLSYGTHMPRSDWNAVESFLLKMPPTLAEQNAIAEVLSEMEQELVTLKMKLEKARAIKQGMMQQLLTGKARLV